MAEPTKALSQIQQIDAYLAGRMKSVDAKLPSSIALKPERVISLVQAKIREDAKLASCTKESIWLAVSKSLQLGLEPCSPLGHSYLVPFKTKIKDANGKDTGQTHMEATLIVGYKGLIALARRSGQIKSVIARVVRKGDVFKVTHGLHENVIHEPDMDATGPLTHVYAVINYVGGGEAFVWLTRAQCEAFRARSRASDSGPWVTDFEAQCMKTAIRRVMTFAPLTTEIAEALDDGDQPIEVNVTPTHAQKPAPELPPSVPADSFASDDAAREFAAMPAEEAPIEVKVEVPVAVANDGEVALIEEMIQDGEFDGAIDALKTAKARATNPMPKATYDVLARKALDAKKGGAK